MEWINIRSATLDSEAFLDASDAAQATWLRLLRYCAVQENGGRLQGARTWSANKWRVMARVEPAEVLAESPLWRWEEGDLLLEFYPLEAEESVHARREAGRRGGTTSSRNKAAAQAVLKAPLEAVLKAPLQRKEMKGKERNERKERNTPLPPEWGERELSSVETVVTGDALEASESPEPPVVVTQGMAFQWRRKCVEAGADYKEAEALDAWQFFHQGRDPLSGSWRIGRTLLTDWRTALERQVTRTRTMARERAAGSGSGADKKNLPPRPAATGERVQNVSQAMASALASALSVQMLGGAAVPEGGAS